MSVVHLMNNYNEHKELVDSYMSGQRTEMMNDTKIIGLSVATFSVILITVLIIWVSALYLIIREWDSIPTWVRVVSIIDIVFGGGFFAIIFILLTKHKKQSL